MCDVQYTESVPGSGRRLCSHNVDLALWCGRPSSDANLVDNSNLYTNWKLALAHC